MAVRRLGALGRALLAVALLAVLLVGARHPIADAATTPPAAQAATRPPTIGVRGNTLVDGAGRPVQLAGVNRSGTEYACAQGWGTFDGPVDVAAVATMGTWGVEAVRIPLNEHCWLGRNGVPAHLGGTAYRAAVRGLVDRLHAAGMVAVLDLHWTAAGSQRALGQAPMPNTDHSVAFWSSVATEYRNVPGVLFELFNEPHGVSWSCWRDGCAMPGGWRAAGMQRLLDAVRATGARQPVIATGLEWGNDPRGWLAHRPTDPAGALVAGFHTYNFNACVTAACWDERLGPVVARVPVIATEVGQTDCRSGFTVGFMRWADARGISYLPWTWNDWPGCSGPALLASYDGTPSSYGAGVRDHLRHRAATRTPASRFTDVPASAPYRPAVDWATAEGIVQGVSATRFGPAAVVSRSQAVTFLWRAAGEPSVPPSSAPSFADVPVGSPSAGAVRWAVAEGVTQGVTVERFAPASPVTRDQAVTFLWRLAGSPGEGAGAGSGFADVPTTSYAADAVRWAADQGITVGTSATRFSPHAPVSRSQFVTFLWRQAGRPGVAPGA